LAAQLDGQEVVHALGAGRHVWLQVARGRVTLDDQPLEQGDGAAASEPASLVIRARDRAEVLLFDLE